MQSKVDVASELKKSLEQDAFRLAWEKSRIRRELGSEVLGRRLQLGLSQRDLARRMGTSQNYIYRIETGRANPTLDNLQRLSEVLGASLKVQLL